MASEASDVNPDDLLARHRQEKKQLQADIMKLKRSVGKGDKKRKKEIDAEIAQLEENLNSKHEQELSVVQVQKPEIAKVSSVDREPSFDQSSVSIDHEKSVNGYIPPTQRISKAQKRREKKSQREKERTNAILEDTESSHLNPRSVEYSAFASQLASRDLQIHEVPADGDCLYNAIAHQLLTKFSRQACGDEMREIAASYIRSNQGEFLPFLIDDDGNELSAEAFAKYCDMVEGVKKSELGGGAWGGQPEIRAISESLEMPIEVLQADAPKMTIGEQFDRDPIIITYHKHAYRLGEHYNSTEPKQPDTDNEEMGS